MPGKTTKTISEESASDEPADNNEDRDDRGESIVVTNRSMAGHENDTPTIAPPPKVRLAPLTSVPGQTTPGAVATTAAAEPSKDDNFPSDINPEAVELAAAEADIKSQEKIDALIESQAYVLPIDTAGKRASRLVAIFGAVLIAALALLLVDLMLDAGFVQIPGVKSVTHFFSV